MSKEIKIVELKSDQEAGERIPLFTIDGVEYTIPAKAPFKVALKFMNEAKRSGNDTYAALQLLEDMLGKDAYEKLLDFDGLTDDLMGEILTQCIERAFPDVSDTVKN
ncbi:hypothetical protein [Streptomyces sp. NPDC088847]|uniref:hypothetical protein n=1 Tax=Streptomyces sp. NPDC088847 TaxID=3365909 RepID=UPI0038069917